MSENPKDEVLELLREAAEQARYLGELGVEIITLETASTVSVAAPAVKSALVKQTQEPAATATAAAPARRVSTTTGPQDSLFESLATAQPVFAQSNETLEDIWRDIGDCTRCGLCEGRTQVVNTHGNRKARLMFVGEAPGADEDAQGKPFVGRAGQLLTKMIEAMGIKREDVIIGNVNRCRPPGNRQPTLEEAAICRPFLFREIAAVQPEIIVVMGNTALRNLLEVREGITRVRGKFQDFRGIKVMPTFHPAYLLRDPSKKRETWEDLKMVRDHLDKTAA
jgi:uracil-DNA glycosylase family 4